MWKLIVLFDFAFQFLSTNYAPWCLLFVNKNWDAKSNKTIDFLYEIFIFKHFLAVTLLLSTLLSKNL